MKGVEWPFLTTWNWNYYFYRKEMVIFNRTIIFKIKNIKQNNRIKIEILIILSSP